jgi:hypothetical protein
MKSRSKLIRMWPVLAIVACAMLATALVATGASGQGDAAAAKGSNGGKYTVVETDGELLIVTDNSSNTLYFYTLDEGSQPGDAMKLRGAVDLNQVGNASIKPRLAKRAE